MDKPTQRRFLDLIATEAYGEALSGLLTELPAAHPAHHRVSQLDKRYRELRERINLGTLNKDDIARVEARIGGGLRDVIREYKPLADTQAQAVPVAKEVSFKLDLSEPITEATTRTDWNAKGFFGELDYTGSPTKQTRIIDLRKSYGAAYHTAREAVKKAGMDMVRGDRDGGQLEAQLAPSGGGGYGEKILMWLTPTDPGTTRVTVVVDSQLPTLAIDFGRNKTKLGILCSYLR